MRVLENQEISAVAGGYDLNVGLKDLWEFTVLMQGLAIIGSAVIVGGSLGEHYLKGSTFFLTNSQGVSLIPNSYCTAVLGWGVGVLTARSYMAPILNKG